jgi:hypothetical protein
MPRRPSAEDVIAATLRTQQEADAHRALAAVGWRLTTQAGRTFAAERAGVRLEAGSLSELRRQVLR